jgi:folate-binding protein YgfZ
MTITGANRAHFWRPAAWLRVSGSDAAVFLQGQFSNDLGLLSARPAVYGLWLNQKGRVLADSFLLKGGTPEEFWVGSYFSPATAIRERLESHIIADDVTVADESEAWFGAALFGPRVAEKIQGSRDQLVFSGRRGREEWIEVLTRGPLEAPGATMWSKEEMERVRIQAALPAVPKDIGPGELPPEGGLERDAISYTKGCYLGQEVMARLRSMGQVRRQLKLIAGSGPAPTCPAKLYQGAQPVGEIRSVAADGEGFVGLALLTLLHWQRGTALGLAPEAAASIVVRENA